MTGPAGAQEWISREKVIAILRMPDAVRAMATCRALAEQGLTVIEITADSSHALDSVAAIRAELGGRVLLGVGTVLDPGTVRRAAGCWRRFLRGP